MSPRNTSSNWPHMIERKDVPHKIGVWISLAFFAWLVVGTMVVATVLTYRALT